MSSSAQKAQEAPSKPPALQKPPKKAKIIKKADRVVIFKGKRHCHLMCFATEQEADKVKKDYSEACNQEEDESYQFYEAKGCQSNVYVDSNPIDNACDYYEVSRPNVPPVWIYAQSQIKAQESLAPKIQFSVPFFNEYCLQCLNTVKAEFGAQKGKKPAVRRQNQNARVRFNVVVPCESCMTRLLTQMHSLHTTSFTKKDSPKNLVEADSFLKQQLSGCLPADFVFASPSNINAWAKQGGDMATNCYYEVTDNNSYRLVMQFRNCLQGKKNSDISHKRTLYFNFDVTKGALTLNIQSAIDDFMGSFIVSQKVSGVFNPQEKEQKKSTSICFEQLLKAYETHLLQGWKGVSWVKESKLQNEATRNILHDLY